MVRRVILHPVPSSEAPATPDFEPPVSLQPTGGSAVERLDAPGLADALTAILRRDLRALAREIESYPDDTTPWALLPGLPNSAGGLVRHVCGNLQHFIGAELGRTGFRRDRAAEFAAPPVSRATLLALLSDTESMLHRVLPGVTAAMLAEPYPQPVAGTRLNTGDFLLHLAGHCAFHLGQVDYHRRAVTGEGRSIGPVAIPELASARPVP